MIKFENYVYDNVCSLVDWRSGNRQQEAAVCVVVVRRSRWIYRFILSNCKVMMLIWEFRKEIWNVSWGKMVRRILCDAYTENNAIQIIVCGGADDDGNAKQLQILLYWLVLHAKPLRARMHFIQVFKRIMQKINMVIYLCILPLHKITNIRLHLIFYRI